MQQLTDLLSRRDEVTEQLVIASLILCPDEMGGKNSIFPLDAFWSQKNRQVYKALLKTHRETGATDAHLIARNAAESGHPEIALYLGGLLAETHIADSPTFMAGYLPAYAQRLRAVYADRERAKATLAYQQTIADGGDEAEARVILDATLDALDSLDPALEDDGDVADLIVGGRMLTGVTSIDATTGGFTAPGLNVIAARPSVGKSALLRTIIRNLAREHRVFWYSLDQSKAQIYELEAAAYLRRDTDWARTATRQAVIDTVRKVREEAWRGNVILIDKPLPLPTLLSHARSSGAAVVAIDYLQAVDSGVNEREYDAVTRTSKALKALALEMGVPVIALSQLSRQAEAGEAPSLSHLRASGQVEQDADQVWGLQRDTSLSTRENQTAMLHVLKNKTGPTAKVALTWVGRYAGYEMAARNHP